MRVPVLLLLAFLARTEALPCFWGWSSPQGGYACVKLAPFYNLYYKQRPGSSNISIGIEVAPPPAESGDYDGPQVSWAGFGVSQAGGMKGADIFTGENDDASTVACVHAYQLHLFYSMHCAQQRLLKSCCITASTGLEFHSLV